jgi:hypothetical protein
MRMHSTTSNAIFVYVQLQSILGLKYSAARSFSWNPGNPTFQMLIDCTVYQQ